MSRRASTSKSGGKLKPSSCHSVAEGKTEKGSAFEELQRELERELQDSERVLTAASNYKGSSTKKCVTRGTSESFERSLNPMSIAGEKSFSKIPQPGPSVPSGVSKKKAPVLSNNTRMHESHKLKFQQHDHHNQHDHHHHESRSESPKLDEKSQKSLQHLSKLKKSPSHFKCDVDQGVDFLKVCCPKLKEGKRVGNKIVKLPEAPCLQKEQVEELIKCESQDVESVLYLKSEERRMFKKPCPKQQRAQMQIRALSQGPKDSSHNCGGVKYSPLEHPEPEDISPGVAAAMMFLQEQGVKMEDCPYYTIKHFFPDGPKPPIPEKGSVSVVDPNQRDQEQMIEKSASVPSEGVSDSAYSRKMRGKDVGPQRSYDVDFAIGQSKREYVFVAQKPQRINMVRFRGGSAPFWFPWYFSAFPDDEEGFNPVNSPSGLFYKAWLYSNPENIPTNDVIVLD